MAAHQRTQRRRSTQRKRVPHPDLCKRVIERIKQGWPPEQIGNRMIYAGAKLRVCQETIYRYIYSKEGMSQEVRWYLPENRKSRRPRRARSQSSAVMLASCSARMIWRIATNSDIRTAI